MARGLASVLVLVLPMMLAGSLAGPAYAAPGDAGDVASVENEPTATGLALPWSALGLPSSVNLFGENASGYTVALPDGLTATRLQGTVHAPINIDAGYLEIDDGEGKFLGAVDLPPAGSGAVMTPFDVDISAARVKSSAVDLSFTIRPRDDRDRFCRPLPQLQISDLRTVFAGTQLPVTTVANFFAPVLGKVTFYAPNDASSAEQQAVLALTAALGRYYATQPVAISVVSQPRGAVPPPTGGLDRAIVVEKGDPGLTVENPGTPDAYLRVSGDGDGLVKQVSLIATQLQPLAQASAVRVDQAGSSTAQLGDTVTFSQLNLGDEKVDTFGTSNLEVGFQRTLLGQRFDSVQVHLLADYTPVADRAAASVVIRSSKSVVYRALLNNTGRLDATFTLDSSVLDQQWVNLQFALTYTPDQPCGPFVAPLTFQVNPQSTLTMHRGGPPLGGFAAFPSELSPKFVVALDGSGPNQLSYAARIVAAVARLSKAELMPQVVDVQKAASATSGALIIANSDAIKGTPLTPPVGANGSTLNIALPTQLQLNIDKGLGSIQAFADPARNRSVILVTTTSNWALVDPLFNYFNGPSGDDWTQLRGDVLAAGESGNPVNVAIRQAGGGAASGQPASSTSRWSAYGYIAGGVVALVALAAFVVTLLLRRRRTQKELVGTEGTGNSD
ncbi:hypothetical protein BST42_08030 [Mycolicibacterium rhodesiae]|uniref:Cellulose biosynthesis cyclic di-GMP-binding regulatory protein BcsB n=2 Tax=Mycolicibacterium rhodesiae TaxID=36814 RepID=A0A1X0J0K2_MYCRH|nr:heme exporter protein CcmD [Mycolicibacterium rhodesiae]ORB54743.1 hypothetical protein BST42_08030 [Mycolicibacterium rhodesiae]